MTDEMLQASVVAELRKVSNKPTALTEPEPVIWEPGDIDYDSDSYHNTDNRKSIYSQNVSNLLEIESMVLSILEGDFVVRPALRHEKILIYRCVYRYDPESITKAKKTTNNTEIYEVFFIKSHSNSPQN